MPATNEETRGKYNVPAGMTFHRDPEGLRDIIKEMSKQFGAEGESTKESGAVTTLMHDRIRWRRRHLQNDPSVDPALPEQWKGAQVYQTPILRKNYMSLLTRGTENHYVGHVRPLKDTPKERKRANTVEMVMNSGELFIEERSGMDFQAELLASQIADCYGIIHWCKAEHLMPPVPEPEYYDDPRDADDPDSVIESDVAELDEDEAVAEAEEHLGYIDGKERRKRRKYREKSGNVIDRWQRERAKAGYPWWVEVIDPLNVAFVEDRSLANGMSRVLVMRDMPLSDYVDKLRSEKDDPAIRTLAEASSGKLQEYGQREGPDEDEPSAAYWGKRVRVYQLWTRTEFYEVISGTYEGTSRADGGDVPFHCVKGFRHPYKMPPFARADAIVMPSSDPVYRYLPLLENLYTVKPIADRAMTLFMLLAEQSALPYQYWENPSTGETWTGEDGESIRPKANSSGIDVAPAGYVLKTVERPINPALVQALELVMQELKEAEPPSGYSQVGASTQPWTIRLDQQQQSVLIKHALKNTAKALAVMRRNMAYVMSLGADDGGFAGPVCVYGRERDSNGDVTVDYSEMATVWPEDVESLDVYVTIDAISSAERITLVEHGLTLLKQQVITEADFFENYMGKSDPDEYIMQLRSEQIYNTLIVPSVARQMVAELYGDVVLGADGRFIGPDGNEVPPGDVLASRGIDQATAGMLAGMLSGQSGGSAAPMQTPGGMGATAGPLPGLQGPQGVMPLGGMVG